MMRKAVSNIDFDSPASTEYTVTKINLQHASVALRIDELGCVHRLCFPMQCNPTRKKNRTTEKK